MGTQSVTLSIAKLQESRDKDRSTATYFLEVPAFQRGLVWKLAKKTALIHSISEGFPIGALLMYVKPEKKGNRTVLQVIDGLQRSTAILDYTLKPLLVAPVADEFIADDTYSDLREKLSDEGFSLSLDELRTIVDDWAAATQTTKPGDGFQASKIRKRLEEKLGVLFDAEFRDSLEDFVAESIIQKLQTKFEELSQYEIPVILYSGDDANLPEIFEALNSGTPLTKYDKFGATWNQHKAITKKAGIRNAMRERYRVYVEKDWEVADFDPNHELGEDDLNIFEYLVGLGHLLSDKYRFLFTSVDYKDEAPSWAFALATLCHGLRLNEMSQLPSKIKKSGDRYDLNAFTDALDWACEKVNEKLGEFLSLKLNATNPNDRFIPHSEMQVISLISRLVIENYSEVDFSKRRGNAQDTLILENLQSHYVSDILRDAWKGSGDSTAFRRVWDVMADGSLSRSGFYTQKPLWEEMNGALDEFHNGELRKNQSDRSNISNKTKMLLRILYTDIITHKDNKTVNFQIEHLYPVKELTDFIAANHLPGLPISAFGNLAILSQSDNVIKGKNFIGDYMANPRNVVSDPEKITDYIIYPDPLDIKKEALVSEDQYRDFCLSRFEAQKSEIMKNLGYSS